MAACAIVTVGPVVPDVAIAGCNRPFRRSNRTDGASWDGWHALRVDSK